MRSWGCVCAFILAAAVSVAEEPWAFHDMALTATDAWHAMRADSVSVDTELAFRNDGRENGFVFAREGKPRQTIRVEADVRVGQRLAKQGWSFAGVSLFQDDANYWMLALVEGPDGARSVDFLEKHAGVWQAQNEGGTALKREGSVSFAWQTGTVYRLTLSLENGCVSARIGEPLTGRLLGKAVFALGAVPAVRFGRPALIAHGAQALCSGFRFAGVGKNEKLASPRVALLDDGTMPGHDSAANARLAEVLSGRGLQVSRLPADELLAAGRLTAEGFDALIVPNCDAVQTPWAAAVQRFAAEGGHLVFLGGPFLDRGLVNVNGVWRDPDGLREVLASVCPENRPFVVGPALDLQGWRRACQDPRTASSIRVVPEGPHAGDCLRVDIAQLQGWDVRHSPTLNSVFGKGDSFFTFQAKGDAATTQLAVEITEHDGSRWIATVPLSTEWRRVGLGLQAFRYWKDSGTKSRGGAGDRLNPGAAVRVGFGLSASHTSAVGPGAHTFWLAEIGTAPDPVGDVGAAINVASIECVYPRYKVHVVGSNTVCAIPRMEGEGFGRGARWRFIPLREVNAEDGGGSGICEWLLVNTRFPLEGSVTAGFGYADPAVWSSPSVAARIADTLVRVTRGTLFEAAGTEQFAYWPGETVRLGARVRRFGGTNETCRVTAEISQGKRVVWREQARRDVSAGAEDFRFEWLPPETPGEYRVTVRLEGATSDEISHGFAVLDPLPAPKSAFVTAKDGDFWLRGEKWYPVGVNFWPLYVSGMDQSDYWPGWLRDGYYAPSLVERDLAQLRDLGVNMVSIQTPPVEESRNLLDFLRLCGRYGIHVNVYVGLASPLAFDDAGLKRYLEAARLPGNATIFAYDTIWEPGNHVFKDSSARARWDAQWRTWIDERYGSLDRAEKDWKFKARRDDKGLTISPEDKCFREDGEWRGMTAAYRRFMDNLTSRLWGRASRRLRELDPNHLVSFRQGNTLPYDFALSGPVKHIDFICPEGYSIRDTDEGEDAIGFITRYVDLTTGGKPIVWSEFGMSVWDNGRMDSDEAAIVRQGRYSERFYRTALSAGANGTVPWWWVGGYRVDERSDFGIVDPSRRERPAARLIREYGPRLKATREKPVPDTWFTFDRDAHAGGYWQVAFHEGAATYRAAAKQGHVLGVRTEGTGCDSVSVPLVAVGNVTCDGTNPPKYLDAEFNMLQVLNADGVWQDVEKGAAVIVKSGRPVHLRASVGNTQEAAWLPGDATGAVALTARVDGLVLRRWSVTARVPYLGDAVFQDLELMMPAAQTSGVSLRLESIGRTPFGEARSFKLQAR